MHRSFLRLAAALTVAVVAAVPSLAAGPVDGEITAIYWMSDTELEVLGESVGSESTEAIGYRAEFWFVKRLGVSAGLFAAEFDGGDEVDYNHLDVKWRLLSPTENSFLAVGAGWQQLDDGGDDTGGVRIVLDGRVAVVGFLYVYGRAAWVPALDDLGDLEDGSMTELEGGLMIKPFPFVQLFAGWRSDDVAYDGFEWTTDGWVAGFGVNF